MRILYNFLTQIAAFHLRLAALFSKKLNLFVSGRKTVFETLGQSISPEDETIWFHCASLGEFEQGFPIMQAVKAQFPKYKIVVSFFSPSGYEIKKTTPIADVVVYLPLDKASNAQNFVAYARPKLALFVKYEIWPNYLYELEKNSVPTLLISGLFRKNQIFFKPYGGFMKKALNSFDHIFVQDRASEELLLNININQVTVSGDTRFDRVSHQIEQDNSLDFIKNFKGNCLCIVCGSTWQEDEQVLLDYINSSSEEIKFIIAPHKIDTSKIEIFCNKILKSSAIYSELPSEEKEKEQVLSQSSVLIIDTIGLLTKIYSYADIAYVGGAMGTTGLHNILEAATFGVPVVIGKNFENFPEAKRLQQLAGLFSVSNSQECGEILDKLAGNKNFRSKTGMIAGHFVNSNTGATKKTMEYIKKLHQDGLI